MDAHTEKSNISQSSLNAMLRSMESRAKAAEYPDQKARILNLAGDLCFDAGEREQALGFYGRSIDLHIAHKQYNAAVAICQKIVRLTPEVVRARCTLAWMAVARGLIEEAQEYIAARNKLGPRSGSVCCARTSPILPTATCSSRD